MLDIDAICDELAQSGMADLCWPLPTLLAEKIAPGVHGDLQRWLEILAELPDIAADRVELNSAAITAYAGRVDPELSAKMREQLMLLQPWRKGPFRLFDVDIDAEWRSDLKWQRLAGEIDSLDGRRVLDVGCGNGYYALRMKGAGAGIVIGIDPALRFVLQFAAIQKYLRQSRVHVLPLRLAALPGSGAHFDTAFSMGVLYHQREPLAHLRELNAALCRDGELVLETLILPGGGAFDISPGDRYARMRNVWRLPSIERLDEWLDHAGFGRRRLIDVSITTTNEQRSTAWMPYESLDKALRQDNPALTVEGMPRPRRALIICRKRR